MEKITKVKICGITNKDDAILAADAGADAIGLIFSQSPRKITIEKAQEIVQCLPPFVTVVGVFVNETPEYVAKVFVQCKINTFQFHGDESAFYCQNFPSCNVIKAFRIKDKKDIEKIGEYTSVDAVLLDSFTENVMGGSGNVFNWDYALEAKKFNKPIILSGGLNPSNIVDAIKKVKPYAVDVSSGVEIYPGKKDIEKVRLFINKVKKFQYQ